MVHEGYPATGTIPDLDPLNWEGPILDTIPESRARRLLDNPLEEPGTIAVEKIEEQWYKKHNKSARVVVVAEDSGKTYKMVLDMFGPGFIHSAINRWKRTEPPIRTSLLWREISASH